MPAKKSASPKSCCPSCPLCCCPDKFLPWILAVLFSVLIFASAIYAYRLYLSRQVQVWKEPPFTEAPTETPLPDTSNWSTYRNTKYGFEFKYSANYFKYKQESDRGIYLAPSAGQGGNGPKFLKPEDAWLNAEQLSYSSATTADEFINSNSQNYTAGTETILTTIGGSQGYKIRYHYAAVAGDVTAYNVEGLVLKDNKLYKITLSSWDENTIQKLDTTFDQILSTFKFLDSTSSLDTSTWKTYKNDQFGFEFQYPAKYQTENNNFSLVSLNYDYPNKSKNSSLPDIYVRHLSIKPGEKFQNILKKDAILDGSGLSPTTFDKFLAKKINSKNFYFIKTGLFEGVLSLNYYYVGPKDIVAFNLVSQAVDWTNPSFNVDDDPIHKDLIQILSTLKFLDSASSLDTSTWKTYKNDKYGFEFKYPANWTNQAYDPFRDISNFGEQHSGGTPGDPFPLRFTVSLNLGERPVINDEEAEIINKEKVSISQKIYSLTTYKRLEAEFAYEISEIVKIPTKSQILYLVFSHVTDGCALYGQDQIDERNNCAKRNQDRYTEYQSLRNQILSTFKFLN